VIAPLIEDALPALSTGIGAISLAVGVMAGPIRTGVGLFLQLQRTVAGVAGVIGGLVGSFNAAGANLINGFVDGIRDAGTRVRETVLAPIRDAVTAVRKLLHIASPSKVFAQIGAFTAEGFIQGVESLR